MVQFYFFLGIGKFILYRSKFRTPYTHRFPLV
nr:MAG TPA: hypothetical protein [Caudoviricetes sp.]